MARTLWLAAAGVVLVARPAAAQVQFAWADTAPRVERYTTPEECLAATWRMRKTLLEYGEVWRDTVPATEAEAREPLPAQVIAAARQCSARFDPKAVPVADYYPVAVLYLLANRDADAETLVKRRLAAIAPKAGEERAAVLDTVIRGIYVRQGASSRLDEANFLRAQPPRLAMAEPLARELLGMKAASWEQRLKVYLNMLQAAKELGDSARIRWSAEGVIAAVAAIPVADQRTTDYGDYVRQSFLAMEVLAGDSLMDSLRRSTAGYVALQRANWAKASGESPQALRMPIGQRAPAVQGDFWFRRSDSATSRPTMGKISLVAFLDHKEDLCELSGRCYMASAVLHRVAARFPEVEITVVARTRGYLSQSAPLTPAQEADTLASRWLERHALPGALAVTATDFWRLPEPDRRRIDRERANELNYSFGRHWGVRQNSAYLIDRSGIIIGVFDLTERTTDGELRRLLEAVSAQPLASR